MDADDILLNSTPVLDPPTPSITSTSSIPPTPSTPSIPPTPTIPSIPSTTPIPPKILDADSIINYWRLKFKELYTNITDDVLTVWNNVVVDNYCDCNSGKCSEEYKLKTVCMGCNILSKLFPKSEINIGSLITIQTGKYKGNRYFNLIKKSVSPNRNRLGNYVEYPYKDSIIECLRQYGGMISCQVNYMHVISTINYYGYIGSELEHYAVISSIINNLLEEYKVYDNCSAKFIYVCNSEINIILKQFLNISNLFSTFTNEYASKIVDTSTTTSTTFTPSSESIQNQYAVVKGILLQLFSMLMILSKQMFKHSNASLQFLKYEEKQVDYVYDGIRVTCPYKLHLLPTTTSSINIPQKSEQFEEGGINPQTINRVYYSNLMTPIIPIELPEPKHFTPILSKPFIDKIWGACGLSISVPRPKCLPTENIVGCYKCNVSSKYFSKDVYIDKIISDSNESVAYSSFINMVTGPLPLFYMSYDTYCFFVSLMCDVNFYKKVYTNQQIFIIWKNLWKPDEFENVNADVCSMHLSPIKTQISTPMSTPMSSKSGGVSKPEKEKIIDIASPEEIKNIVSKYYLRCDALSYVWGNLKLLE